MGDDPRLRAVLGMAQAITAAQTPDDVARAVAPAARTALNGSFAAVSVREQGQLRALARSGTEPPAPAPLRQPSAAPEHGRRVVAAVVVSGRPWGELLVVRAPGQPAFDRGEQRFATEIATMTAAGIAQCERLAEAHRLAHTDALTGLANRRAADARLAEALERHRAEGAVVSLVVCDINGLKRVNDIHGHAAGDRLLQRFASVLTACAATLPGALVARLGGDEFALVAAGPSADEVVKAAEEVCRGAAELELSEGVACGVASTGDPIGAVHSARRLFRLADAAQYRAKTSRSGTPVVAGRHGGRHDPVVRLADAPRRGRDRRRFRGQR